MAIIDAALVLVDGQGHTNIMDMHKPTSGGFNNLNGWINVRTTAETGAVTLQECDTEGGTYSNVIGGEVVISANKHSYAIPFPKTSKRFVKISLTAATASNTAVYVGGLNEEKELA